MSDRDDTRDRLARLRERAAERLHAMPVRDEPEDLDEDQQNEHVFMQELQVTSLAGHDDRIERMIADPETYFAEARQRAEKWARESVARDLR